MSYFAHVENGVVTQVMSATALHIMSLADFENWIQTSYNTFGGKHKEGGRPMRGNFAGVGFTYDYEKDVFIAPQPHPDCTLDPTTWLWVCPMVAPEELLPSD